MGEQTRKPDCKNKPVRLQKTKHKLTAVSRAGERINIRYRRYIDKNGKVRHEIIGPFDLTEEKHRS